MSPATLQAALAGSGPKGPVLEVARLAGIQGGKRTSDLIPLCHPLPLDALDVSIEPVGDTELAIVATVVTTWKTGVEMEALTAVCVAGLTVIDMLKALERDLVLTDVRMEEKSGGRSGSWVRTGARDES
jgi:cyclic pyranopterin phosphate synthase